MAFDNTSVTFPQVNQRRTAAGTWDLSLKSAEAFTTSLDADSIYSAQLAEVPAAANTDGSNAAPVMTNSGGGGSYTLTTSTTPSAGEFYVDYDNGVVIVNSADHTAQSGAFEMTYYGKGTVLKADEINAIVSNSTTLNSSIVTSSLTTVGALNSGSITSGFGAIDNGTSNITTGGILKIDVDGTAENAAGSLTLGAGNDAGIFFDGTNLQILTNGAGASGIILDSEDDTVEIKGSGTLQATFDTSGLNLVSGDAYYINSASVLNATTLGTAVVTSSLTTVGALNSGSITSGFGAIDIGSDNLTATGTVSLGATTFSGNAKPSSNDGASLGESGTAWSDVFIASEGVINFNAGDITLTHSSNTLTLSGGTLATGGETAPDVDAGGLCLNHGANDGYILSFKNSDASHPFTTFAETDTYYLVSKASSTEGGFQSTAFSEGSLGNSIRSMCATEITTDISTSTAANIIQAYYTDGATGITDHGSTGNIFCVRNNNNTRFILKGNGDAHITNTTITALDDHNDIDLARNLQLALGGEKYKHKVSKADFNKLVELGAVSSTGDFQIIQGCTAVTLGAISQLYNAMKGVANKLGIGEQELIEMARTY